MPTSKRLRVYYWLCYAVTAGALAVIGWRLLTVHLPAWRGGPELLINEAMFQRVLNRPLQDQAGTWHRLGEAGVDYLVVFLFTPADCAACLPELRGLARLDAARPDLGLALVMSFSNQDEARQTRESFGLKVPILQDPDGEVLEALAPPKTPWKIVVRLRDRKILFENPPNVGEAARAAFLARLADLDA